MKIKSIIGSVCFMTTGLLISCQNNQGTIYPDCLVSEYQNNPQAIETSSPRLEWVDRPTNTNTRGLSRTAYQIEAASSRQALLQGKADLWDSGKVEDNQSLRIAYAGQPLSAGTLSF